MPTISGFTDTRKFRRQSSDVDVSDSMANVTTRKNNAVQSFLREEITLTELAEVFNLDHIDTIVWLKENGFNPPSIQGYSENGFTQEFEDELDRVTEEAEKGIGLSPAFDNADDLLAHLHKESEKENINES